MNFTPPTAQQVFILNHVLNAELEDAAPILEAAGQLAAEAFAPLNRVGDKNPARLIDGKVITPAGFKEAYRQFIDGGWNGLTAPAEFGGQGLPNALAMAVQELWQGANVALALCGLLNQGAIEALATHGTDQQKVRYLPALISGTVTGTMNLTEPQAGSDVGAVSTRAVRQADGSYRLYGQKIYISYGDHDLTDNILHLVLARTEGAPSGTKGLSLFLVPKILPDGRTNDVKATSLEHKLGQHGSPTAVMIYGDQDGAVAELLGQENGGMACMFTMMNDARLGVGLQGLGLCERAYQQAVSYANERRQGGKAISDYPDVQRMLLTMECQIDAGRALAYSAGLAADSDQQARVDLLTPLVKSYLTDLANELTSLNIQVHGGMGYIEETGAAQHYRDARVLAIYEGTNGIQANDFLYRKVLRDKGAALYTYLDEIGTTIAKLGVEAPDAAPDEYGVAVQHARAATDYVLATVSADKGADGLAGVATTFLRLIALTALAGMQARILLALPALPTAEQAEKKRQAQFFATHLVAHTGPLLHAVKSSTLLETK